MKNFITTFLATFAWVGFMRPAPGTWGSLAALPIGVWVLLSIGWPVLLFITIIAYLVGIWASDLYAARIDKKDPSEVVLDEVAGQWMALTFAAPVLWQVILAFALFRLFDIWKPWMIGHAERLPGGLGIMTDDMISGLVAGVLVLLCRLLLPI